MARVTRDKALVRVALIGAILSGAAIALWREVIPHDSLPTYGPSMEPTLVGEVHVQVDFGAYEGARPALGDIVVFSSPQRGRGCPPADALAGECADVLPDHLLKRVVGGPGDHVEFTSAGRVIRNGKRAREPFISPCRPAFCRRPAVRLRSGEYFLAGDNRGNSTDSRDFGAVRLERIEGRVELP